MLKWSDCDVLILEHMAKRILSYTPPTDSEIACYAFAIVAQQQPAQALDAWHEAKAQLIADRQHDAGMLTAPVKNPRKGRKSV